MAEERQPVRAVVVERNANGDVTIRGVRHGEPMGTDHRGPRAYVDNFIYESKGRAVEVAIEEVSENGLRGAVAWQSGIGDWLVNGWR